MVGVLDAVDRYPEWDRSNMLSPISGFISQIEEALRFKVGRIEGITNYCLCGIGGSAMSGDVIRDYVSQVCDEQITVIRGVKIPRWVSGSALVVITSYSGNTRESLDMYDDAVARGLKVVCISSGGKLLAKAADDGVQFVKVPSGIQPRAALGYLIGSLAVIMDSAGSCRMIEDVRGVLEWCRERQRLLMPSVPSSANVAKKIALAIKDSVPVIYVPESIRCVGTRWQNQINENAKTVAFCGEIPEMDHNQLVGWLSGFSVSNCRPVFVVPSELEPTVKKMTTVTVQMFNERGLDPVFVQLEGTTLMQNIISGLVLGDMVSYYLARLKDIDPEPVEVIKEFKERIGR